MTKYFLLAFLLLAPASAFAADFTATVADTHVSSGEGFALQLALSGADATESPNLSPLKQDFDIMGQAQTSNTTIVNGHMSSSEGWQLNLIPKQTGQIIIPSLTIDTDKGQLSTQPITLNVGTSAPQATTPGTPLVHQVHDISVNAAVNQSAPYQDQPIIYTVRIVTQESVSDLSLGDVKADNAIFQRQGDMEIKDGAENGVPLKIIEVRYLVTPLKAGTLIIPPPTVEGSIESEQPMPRLGNMGNGFIDPMAIFQQMGHFGFMQSKPFSITGNAITLNVKAPAATMEPWLPLKEFKITERLSASQPIKVGDPVTRTFTLLADGMVGSQLPNIEMQLNTDKFKVYADKPTATETIDKKSGEITGRREESFSLIPLTAGILTLPEIKIPWWDVTNNHLAYAIVPERTLQVLAAPSAASPTQQNAASSKSAPPPLPSLNTPQQAGASANVPVLWYSLVALLSFILLATVLWAFTLQRKISQRNAKSDAKSTTKDQPPKQRTEIRWDQIHTAEDLNRNLLTYGHNQWGTPMNAALETVFAKLCARLSNPSEKKEIEDITRELTAALYAGKSIDLEDLKRKCRAILETLHKPNKKQNTTYEKLPKLNPS